MNALVCDLCAQVRTVPIKATSVADTDLDPDPFVRGTDLDPSVIKQIALRKTLISTVCDFFMTFYL